MTRATTFINIVALLLSIRVRIGLGGRRDRNGSVHYSTGPNLTPSINYNWIKTSFSHNNRMVERALVVIYEFFWICVVLMLCSISHILMENVKFRFNVLVHWSWFNCDTWRFFLSIIESRFKLGRSQIIK